MKYQEQDLQNAKDSNSEERILTIEERTELCRKMAEEGRKFREYMRMRIAQEKAEAEKKAKEEK